MTSGPWPDFSVLLPTYDGDNADELDKAVSSVLNQTIQPNEVVIVQDGPVNPIIAERLEKWNSCSLITIHRLENNQGLGGALKKGVRQSSNPLVARMDSDDICVNDRFERQLTIFKNDPTVDVVGGCIGEFETDPTDISLIRRVPIDHDNIVRTARRRSPMNHGTVMFKKQAVLNAGNYKKVDRMEDYGLWVRMIQNGSKFRNVPQILVKVRAGEEMYRRRGGIEYAKEEIRLQWDFYQWGFTSPLDLLINVTSRAGLRLIPNKLRAKLYHTFARENASHD